MREAAARITGGGFSLPFCAAVVASLFLPAGTARTRIASSSSSPAEGEPPHLTAVLPYELPLGTFIPRSGPANVLPASLDFGVSRHVLPTEVRHTPPLLAAFQTQLLTFRY